MTSESKVLPMTFPEVTGIGYVRVEDAERMPKVTRDFYDTEDSDDLAELAWLDANTPGWTRHRRVYGDPVLVETPVGADDALMMYEFENVMTFARPEHRQAWRDRRDAVVAAHVGRRAAYREAVAKHGPGVEICMECAKPMVPYAEVSRDRIGQFAFDVPQHGGECADCGMRSGKSGVSQGFVDAMDLIADRVGLPPYGSPLWNDGVKEEWRRRRLATPDLVLAVSVGESTDSIVSRLDAALAEAGVPPRGVAPRLVGG